MTSLLVRVGYSVSDSGRTADVSRVKSLHVRQHVHSWRYKAIMLHHSHQSIPHRLLTSLNSLRVLRILALVVPIPSVDDLPLNIISSLPGEKFSHLLFFLDQLSRSPLSSACARKTFCVAVKFKFVRFLFPQECLLPPLTH